MDFGKKVKEQREALGYSQEELADFIGVSRRSVTFYETENRIPRKNMLNRLADALGVQPEYLTDDRFTDPEIIVDSRPYVDEVRNACGNAAADEMKQMLDRNMILLAGGTLDQASKDKFFEAIQKAYFITKNKGDNRDEQE